MTFLYSSGNVYEKEYPYCYCATSYNCIIIFPTAVLCNTTKVWIYFRDKEMFVIQFCIKFNTSIKAFSRGDVCVLWGVLDEGCLQFWS
jgi:hypothetical protein